MKSPSHAALLLSFFALASFTQSFADVLAITHEDFSLVQGTAGLQYGYYTEANSTAGTFSTAGMAPSGPDWRGTESSASPVNGAQWMHPGLTTKAPAVRRYTVGSGTEASFSGTVRITGRFYSTDRGLTNRFVTVNGTTLFVENNKNGETTFDVSATVSDGSTIDLGVAPGEDASSDSVNLMAWIVTPDTSLATQLVGSAYNSPGDRSACLALATDGVVGAADAETFDTGAGAAFPYQFAGLLYGEGAGSGKATCLDSVRVDVTTANDFADVPRLYVLRHNSDPNTSNPAADDRYARLPIVPVRSAANSAGQPYYTFDLSSLTAAQRTGYGFAVVGAGANVNTPIVFSEVSAVAARVADSTVIAPQPFFVSAGGHRYARSVIRGDWEQVKLDALNYGANLVQIEDAPEQQLMVDLFGGTEILFIGLYKSPADPVTPASYKWTTGMSTFTPLGTYQNWLPSQPDAYQNKDDYVEMNYGGAGLWANMGVRGHPETGDYCGIIELPTPGSGLLNFQLGNISAKSNIFDAGLTSPTQGGVLPPSVDVSGLAGGTVTFPQVVGIINTAADLNGPDGAHTPGRSCDLNAVGGISGYRNDNNTPALVGVFLGASQPASAPVTLNFSANAVTENFTTLSPALGQVFFIGDGFTNNGVAQQFVIPAGATKLYFGIPDGNNGTLYYHGTPAFYGDNDGAISLRAVVTAVVEADIVVEQPEGSPRESGVGTVLFGTSNVNTPVTRTFTIRNSAVATNSLHLAGTKPTVDGPNNAEFVAGDYASTTLAPGASTTVTVTFTPTAGGTRTAAMHIGSDDADENPFDIALSGAGLLPPEIVVSETGGPDLTSGSSTVSFGSTVSGAGLERTFTITNSGVGQLNNVAASIDGADSSSFTVTAQPSTTVAAMGGTTQFTVRFAAGSPAGAKNAILHIASDDADENPFNIALTGTTSGTVINGTFNSPSDVPLTVADLTATGLTLNLTLGFAPAVGTDLTLVNNTGAAPITGTFTGLLQGVPITLNYNGQDYEFALSYTGGTGNDIVLLWPSLTSTPTHLVGSAYNSPNDRAQCFALATDGVFGSSDALTFDTGAGAAFPYQFAGLLYLENPGTDKAARIDSVRVDVTTTNDFADVPRVYLLRHNSDPNTSNPAADDRYARLPIVPVRSAANSAGQPYYTFDLTTLSTAQRTGYGFAVVGSSVNSGTPIVFSEVSAVAARVADSAVIAPLPFLVSGPDNHRYGWSITRGDWDQAETSAVAAGGHLVTINNATEQTYLVTQFGTENVFVGLKQDGPDANTEPGGGWRWRTGELLSDVGAYLNWSGGEPNGYEGADEDYGFMNYASPGTWGDVRVMGYPPAQYNTFRGIIEVPTAGSGVQNFIIASVPATSNIYAAGLTSAPGGGSLPPSIDVSGFAGQQVSFPQIVGVLDTAADRGGPDGPHTAGRSCDLTAVGGISGYRNDDNTPALVGVFLGASQPASPPARIDFSANAIGENFTTLSPELGQVFFIGDGFTDTGAAQTFTIPAGATKLYFGIPDGNDGTLYHGTPLGWGDNSGGVSIRATIVPSVTPTISNAEFPLTGGQLVIFGGTGPYTVTVTSGALPPGMTISSTGLVSGTAANGSYTFTLHVVDSLGAFSDRTFTLVVEGAVPVPQGVLAWWPGEGAVGDIVGGYHGSLKNGATYATGKVDRCVSFDGVDDLMELPDSGALNLAGDFTIEGWINPTSVSGQPTIIGKRSADANSVAYHLYLTNGQLSFYSTLENTLAFTVVDTPMTANAWHHVAVTLAGGQLLLYVDGSLQKTVAWSGTRASVSEPATIGATVDTAHPATNPGAPFPGAIDELSLYNRALTSTEISDICLAGSKGKARHDVAREYSTTNNDGPVWSYRWIPSTDVDAAYDPTAANTRLLSGPNPLYAGAVSIWGSNPSVSYNTTDNDVSGSFSWTPRQFSMHPGPSNECAVLRWKAPHAGQFAVSGTFYGADIHPATTDVHIFHNATQLTPADKRLVNSYRGDGVSHTQIITVATNDTVDFLVGPGGNGYSSDLTGLAASIVEVVPTDGPEIDIEQPLGTHLSDASSTVNFGSSTVLTPVTLDFTVTNVGTTLLTLGTPSADGDFTVGAFGDVTLDPAQSTTLTVSFTPSNSGIRTGVLHILSDDADEASFDISLTGTGTPSASTGNAVFGWGQNINGTIGDGTTTNRFTAVPTFMTGALAGKQVVSVEAGSTHSLALSDDGIIFAWGTNTNGELGDGTTTNRNQPVAVDMSGALNGKAIVACEAGLSYSLALTSDGKVYSWGYNGFGELGLGDTTPRSTPQLVQGLLTSKSVVAISAGPFHAMALTSDGEVYGWGSNASGELGDGTTTTRLSPVAMVKTGTLLAGKTIGNLLCSSGHTVVRTVDNLVFAWGTNSSAQLGDGTTTNRLQPVAVNGALAGKNVVEIAGKQSSHLARTSDGLLYAWGNNFEGQLGDGTKTTRLSPVAVNMSGAMSGKTASSIQMGGGAALVRTLDNLLYTWGNNGNGLLGVGTGPAESLVPVAVDASGSLAGKVIVACGLEGNHALVVAFTPPPDTRVVFGWGDNVSGKIGDGTTATRFTPAPVIMTGALAGKQLVSVVAGKSHSLALSDDGKIFAWGQNTYGELGDGTHATRTTPVAVNMSGALGGKVVVSCVAGTECSLALTSEGKVYSWGYSGYGQLGRDATNTADTPQLVQGPLTGKTVTAIFAGSTHAMALTSDGEVYAWGDNSHGQLGDGTTITRLSPVALVKTGTQLEGKTISSVMCSYRHTLVRTNDGLLFAWGWNADGELGDGTTTDHPQPLAVTGALAGKTVVEITGTHRSHLARTSDGLLYTWGYNWVGLLGDGTTTTRTSPVPVDMSGALNGKTIVSIQMGVASAVARTTDNRLYTWGENQFGELGVGSSPAESHVPVAVNVSGSLAGKTLVGCSLEGFHALVIGYTMAIPDIDVVSTGAVVHTDGSTRDFGTKFVGGSTSNTAVFTIQNVGTAPLTGFAGVNGITIDGANASAFSLSGTVPTSLAPGASTQISVTFDPQAQGAHEAWLHIHSNDPDEEPFDIKLIGTGGVPITDWRQQYFGTSSDTGDAADDADPDHDGVTNLMEFATAGAPDSSSTQPTSVAPPGGDFIEFFYTRNKLAMAELSYEVQWTDDLLTTWVNTGVTETIISDNGTVQQVKALAPKGTTDHRFVRLKVTR